MLVEVVVVCLFQQVLLLLLVLVDLVAVVLVLEEIHPMLLGILLKMELQILVVVVEVLEEVQLAEDPVVPVVPVSSSSPILHKYLKNHNVLQRTRTYIRKLLETR
jgi:hypothetical protein